MKPPAAADESSRVADARARCDPSLRATFAAIGLDYPPAELHLRAFKRERRLEVWARPTKNSDPFVLVFDWPVLGLSGGPGPKRREGDLQVPEGFYRIDRFNPRSRFYLSLGLDYPNESDRQLSPDPGKMGSDIFIHGGEKSRGCLAIGDAAIALLYLLALDTAGSHGRPITVHLFPCRMDTPEWAATLEPFYRVEPALHRFWQSLSADCRRFEGARRLA